MLRNFIIKLKSVQKQLPVWLGWKCIEEFLDKILVPKTIVSTVPKCIMKNKLAYCVIRFGFKVKCKISGFFTFKNRIPSFLRFDIVYKFRCGGWNSKTKRHFTFKMFEHLNICHSLGKELKVMMILPLKNIFYSAITCLILKICQFSLSEATTLNLR